MPGMQDRIALLEKSLSDSEYEPYGATPPELVRILLFAGSPDSPCSLSRVLLPYAKNATNRGNIEWGTPPTPECIAFPGQDGRECTVGSLSRATALSSRLFVAGKTAIVAASSCVQGKKFHEQEPAKLMAWVLRNMLGIGDIDTLIAVDDECWDGEIAALCRGCGVEILYDSTGMSGEPVLPPGCEGIGLVLRDDKCDDGIEVSFPLGWTSLQSRHLSRLLGLDKERRLAEEAIEGLLGVYVYAFSQHIAWLISKLSYGALDVSEEEAVLRGEGGRPGITDAIMMRRIVSVLDKPEPENSDYIGFAESSSLWVPLCVREPVKGSVRAANGYPEVTATVQDLVDAMRSQDMGWAEEAMGKLLDQGRWLGIDESFAAIAQGVPPRDACA